MQTKFLLVLQELIYRILPPLVGLLLSFALVLASWALTRQAMPIEPLTNWNAVGRMSDITSVIMPFGFLYVIGTVMCALNHNSSPESVKSFAFAVGIFIPMLLNLFCSIMTAMAYVAFKQTSVPPVFLPFYQIALAFCAVSFLPVEIYQVARRIAN